jgi:hypothetical protein
MKHKIVVERGKIRTRYTESLPVDQLGVGVVVERAAEVEWSPILKGWTVQLIDGPKLPGIWTERSSALNAEITAVDARL